MRSYPINPGAPSYIRSDFANQKVHRYFAMFLLFTFFTVLFFITEDYQNSIQDELHQTTLSQRVLKDNTLPTYLGKPTNILLLSTWALSCVFFVLVFNRRIKSMLYLFLTLSILVLIFHFFWDGLVKSAIDSPNQFMVRAAESRMQASGAMLTYKTFLLIFWSCFSLFLSFSVVTAKYVGIFSRLDYLFQSITYGNWDANMFFRSDDPFSFLAASFNALKNDYLDQLYATDDQLILIKDSLKETTLSEESRKNILHILGQKAP